MKGMRKNDVRIGKYNVRIRTKKLVMINKFFLLCFIFIFISCSKEIYKKSERHGDGFIFIKKNFVSILIKKKEINEKLISYKFSITNFNINPIYIDTNVFFNGMHFDVSSKNHLLISFGVSLSNLLEDIGTTLKKIGFLKSYEREFVLQNDNKQVGFYFFYLGNSEVVKQNTIERDKGYVKVPRAIVYDANEVYLGWFNAQKKDYNNQILYIFDEKDKKIPKKQK